MYYAPVVARGKGVEGVVGTVAGSCEEAGTKIMNGDQLLQLLSVASLKLPPGGNFKLATLRSWRSWSPFIIFVPASSQLPATVPTTPSTPFPLATTGA